MNNIQLHFRDQWNNRNSTYTKGSAYVKGELLKGCTLTEFFKRAPISDAINEINGFWGLIKKHDKGVLIASDRIRSYPLFYSILNNIAYISDDPYWLKEKVKDVEFDEVSKKEFLLTGFVTGSDTLYKNVKQIQAAEIIYFETAKDNKIQIKKTRYYNFIHKDFYNLPKEELMKEHEKSLTSSIERLLDYVNDRTIVIPLSGGYDSRLIATTLKRLKYNKVITFTYGRQDNRECNISQQVAAKLGFKWIFIPYDNEKSYEWYNSEEKRRFDRFGDNLSSALLDREWPAVWEMKKQKLILSNSVFVPGHTGDFIAGGHIPINLSENASKQDLIDEAFKKYYVMWKWDGVKDKWLNEFSNKILNCSGANSSDFNNDFINAYDKWEWQERHVKIIANSVRIYDYFDYDWWLPLWDAEYMNFWCRVPLRYRMGKKLYDEYVTTLYSKIANISFANAKIREPEYPKNDIFNKAFRKFKKDMNFMFKESKYVEQNELRETDWEQSYGRMTKEVYNKLLPYIVGRSSPITLEKLGYISYTADDVPDDTIKMLKEIKG